MKKIKIGYFADGPWSHNAFNKIVKDDTLEINDYEYDGKFRIGQKFKYEK